MKRKLKKIVLSILTTAIIITSIPVNQIRVSAANVVVNDVYGSDTYEHRFMSVYDQVISKGQENGYMSTDNAASNGFGLPYHAVDIEK